MYDSFNRPINYLRISVTDRCNLRCRYCMPEEGIRQMSHDDILRFEEILEIVSVAVKLGINKIRITGGEPLVRKGITDLVKMIRGVEGVEDLALTTNGQLLSDYARTLKDNGLDRVNISLDTVDAEKYCYLTRGGDIEKVFRGIDAALEAGLHPVKINCVINGTIHDPDARKVAALGRQKGVEVRFIHQMDLKNGSYQRVEGGDGGHCEQCNRLRLTADGKIKPCLFNDLVFDTKILGIEKALLSAVRHKPAAGTINCSGHFYNIGG